MGIDFQYVFHHVGPEDEFGIPKSIPKSIPTGGIKTFTTLSSHVGKETKCILMKSISLPLHSLVRFGVQVSELLL